MAAAPRRTWSRGRAPGRPRSTAWRSVLSLVPRFLESRFPPGVPTPPRGAARIGSPSPEQSFWAAGALRLGKGKFHRARSPAFCSAEFRAPGSSGVSAALSGLSLPSSLWGMKLAEGDEGGRGLILDPVPGKAAPPLLLSVSAPRVFPSLWRWQMGRSATLQPRRQEPLLPSPGGCPPGGHCRQPPPLLSLRLARKPPTYTQL